MQKHNGIDLKNAYGQPIFALHDGFASLKTQYKDGKVALAGHYVEVKTMIDGKTVVSQYFHMQEGRRVSGAVKAGDLIGYQGNSGI